MPSTLETLLAGLGASLILAATMSCTGPLSPADREQSGSAATPAGDCTPRTAPTVALGGTILTPDGAVNGFVVIAGEQIVSVVSSAAQVPAGATVVETDAIISPGLIDLHNHVNYDFLPLWSSGQKWANRFEWATDPGYLETVKAPFEAVKRARHMCQAVKYGELRALVGGTTTIQGSTDLACTRAWVRNVENEMFCEDHVQQHGGALSYLEPEELESLIAGFEDDSIAAFILHLAEGVDEVSRHDFEELRTRDLLRPEVVMIHGTALTDAEFEEMGQIGMKLIWSPLSNLLLYGRTTDIPAVLSHGIMVSLAPDWSVSGSPNLLAELDVADRVDRETFGDIITDEAMFRMVTANPADTVGLQGKIGRIAPGLYADLVVVRGDTEHPHRALIDAGAADVLATFVSGEILYGETRLLDALGKQGQYQTVSACGEDRGLDVLVDGIAGGDETLDVVVQTLETDTGLPVTPLFDCAPPTGAPAGAP